MFLWGKLYFTTSVLSLLVGYWAQGCHRQVLGHKGFQIWFLRLLRPPPPTCSGFAHGLLSQPSPSHPQDGSFAHALFHVHADYGTSSPGGLLASDLLHFLSLLPHKGSDIVAVTRRSWDKDVGEQDGRVKRRKWPLRLRVRCLVFACGGNGNLERVQAFSFYKPWALTIDRALQTRWKWSSPALHPRSRTQSFRGG